MYAPSNHPSIFIIILFPLLCKMEFVLKYTQRGMEYSPSPLILTLPFKFIRKTSWLTSHPNYRNSKPTITKKP